MASHRTVVVCRSGIVEFPAGSGSLVVNLRHNHCGGKMPCSEGEPGEMEYSTMSTDRGLSWSPLRSIEPSAALASHASSLIPSPPGSMHPERLYALYDYNLHNVTHLPNGKQCSRTDDLGEFVMRYTETAGRSWSIQRWVVPYRSTAIDRKNEWKGSVHLMESHTKALIIGQRVYVTFTKYGKCCGQGTPGEGWLLVTDNLFSASDPSQVTWELWPKGEAGLRAPTKGRAEEHFTVRVGSSTQRLFVVFRTDHGKLGAAYSDDGGQSFNPSIWLPYDPNHNAAEPPHLLKNPLGTCKAYQFARHNGNYLMLFYNNAHTTHSDRWTYWLTGGRTVTGSVDGKQYIAWSQPEIALYNPNHSENGPACAPCPPSRLQRLLVRLLLSVPMPVRLYRSDSDSDAQAC